jgi:hypothetical protein
MKEASAAQPNPRPRQMANQRRVGMLQVAMWQKGWGRGKAGMESEEGTAFEYLPRREPCGERTLSA